MRAREPWCHLMDGDVARWQGRLSALSSCPTGYAEAASQQQLHAFKMTAMDAATVERLLLMEWPRVPEHEVVGRVDALGSGVLGWTVG